MILDPGTHLSRSLPPGISSPPTGAVSGFFTQSMAELHFGVAATLQVQVDAVESLLVAGWCSVSFNSIARREDPYSLGDMSWEMAPATNQTH